MKSVSAKSDAREQRPRPMPSPQLSGASASPASKPAAARGVPCACGGGCPKCGKASFLEPNPELGVAGDVLEQEADRAADQVMRMSAIGDRGAGAADSARPARVLQRSAGAPAQPRSGGPVVDAALRSSGQPLPEGSRDFMESRFGHDFSAVRIHKGAAAAASAAALKARAYTVGNDIVFGAAQYRPGDPQGKRLLAHELAHVAQQSGAAAASSGRIHAGGGGSGPNAPAITRSAKPAIARYKLTENGVSADIDFGDVINTPAASLPVTIASRYLAYTGAALDPALVARVAALTTSQQEWVLFALDIVSENAAAAPGLPRALAFERILDRAPASTTRGLGANGIAFFREVLTVSGWFERAISGGLSAPSAARLAVIDPLLNPPPAASAPPGGLLDLPTLQAELPVLTRARLGLSANDPSNWPGVRAQPLAQVQSVGDVIQEQARTFFSPFSETARDNRWLATWQYSGNISSVTTDALGNPAPVTADERLSLLRNRAMGAGWDDSAGDSLFSRTNFDSDRDAADFEALITAMEADPIVRATLERQFRHTGHLERPSLRVAISTEVSSGPSECTTRWHPKRGTIRTLCHELMHSLAHPGFIAAIPGSARFPSGVNFDQVLVEGFAEVLGVQLFNHLRTSGDAALLTSLTQGIAGSCPAPTATALPAYGAAGANAETIRVQVGDQRFRAAYFHGQTALVGL